MKIHPLIIKSLLVASLILPVAAQAEPPQPPETQSDAKNTSKEESGVNLLSSPKLSASGEILFMSGGIGSDNLIQIKKLASAFSLEVVLVERTDEYYRESYIADVAINIKDQKGNVIDTIAEGPYFLANLPNGRYQITATFQNVIRTRTVMVDKNKHARIVLLWDNRTPKETHDALKE